MTEGQVLPCKGRLCVSREDCCNGCFDQPVIHNAAGPCEPGYHRAMPDGSRCRCGALTATAGDEGARNV